MKRVLAYSLLAIALSAAGLTVRWLEARAMAGAELALVGADLATGNNGAARQLLGRIGFGSEPAVISRGLAWCDLLEGKARRQEGAPSSHGAGIPADLLAGGDPFPDAILLRRLVEQGQARQVVDAIQASESPLPTGLSLLADIARLESGDPIAPRSNRPGASPLERALNSVLALRSRGGEQIVRDRRGRLLGAVDQDGHWLATEEGQTLRLDGWIESELAASNSHAPALSALRLPGVSPSGISPSGVRLSIDSELSAIARRALGDVRGTIVVIEPASGRVLAAVSDAKTIEREGSTAFRDQRLEPASIAKLITASAALRAGFDVDHEIQNAPCHGFVSVGDGRLYCPVVPGHLSGMEHAMAVSCNTTFARLGARLGNGRVVDEYRRFGFAPFDLLAGDTALDASPHFVPVSFSPGSFGRRSVTARLRSAIDSQRRLAEVSIGLNHSELSPLHAARMAAIFANGGRLLEPSFLEARDGLTGLSPTTIPVDLGAAGAAARIVIEPRELRSLQAAMAAVPLYGTAAGIAPRDFPVAMKTGTASEPGRGFHVNYIGIAPWPSPRYAFVVRITDQRTSRRVRRAAYAAAKHFLEGLAEYDRVQPAKPPIPRAEPIGRARSSAVAALGG